MEVPVIQNDCSMDEDVVPQLPHTISEILDSITIVKTIEDSKKIISHLMDCHQIISLDIKGRDLGTDRRKISLIALGTCNGQCLIFDIYCNNQLVVKGKLRNLLQCKELIKVMHDCCLIRSALEQCYGIQINSVFDTQCAHVVIEGHRCGKNPRCISQETLLFISTTYGRGVITPAAHALERLYLENSNFWDTRPLPCKLKDFIARGVLALLPEVYNNMNRRLCGPLRQTFRTLCHGKCIEPAEHNALQVLRPGLEDACCKAINADCRCRSCSLTSQCEACARCGSLDTTRQPKSCKTPCKVPTFKLPLHKCVSVSRCTPKINHKCGRKMPTKVSCSCVQCTQYLAGKACATRRYCACTSKIASSNCVRCTEHVTNLSCASKIKNRKCQSNVCFSCNKGRSVCTCTLPKRICRKKRSDSANCSCCEYTPVKSKAICRKRSRRKRSCYKRKLAGKKRCVTPLIKKRKRKCGPTRHNSICLCRTLKAENDPQLLSLVQSGWKAQVDMESETNNENEMDEGEQKVAECNDDDEEEDAEDASAENTDSDKDEDEEDEDEEDEDDEEDFETEILPSAAKRKR